MNCKFNQIRIHALLVWLISGCLFSCSSVRSVSTREPVKAVIQEARTYIGVPYQWGGLTRQGLDCSGLVQLSFRKAGLTVPRTTEGLLEVGKRVKLKKARPGDLLFFALSEKRNKVTHVGIVTQKERGKSPSFIHASTRKGVMEGSMDLRYYQKGFKEARRVVE
jgi:cell wall-associated NlpC family hydrolase